LNILDDSIKKS